MEWVSVLFSGLTVILALAAALVLGAVAAYEQRSYGAPLVKLLRMTWWLPLGVAYLMWTEASNPGQGADPPTWTAFVDVVMQATYRSIVLVAMAYACAVFFVTTINRRRGQCGGPTTSDAEGWCGASGDNL